MARPTKPPTTVPLMRMNCRSGPSRSSSLRDVSSASQRASVPLTRPAISAWKVSPTERTPHPTTTSTFPGGGRCAADAPAGGDDGVGEARPQLRVGVGGLGAQGGLGVDPQGCQPLPQLRVVEQLELELFTALPVLRRVLQPVRDVPDPVVQS